MAVEQGYDIEPQLALIRDAMRRALKNRDYHRGFAEEFERELIAERERFHCPEFAIGVALGAFALFGVYAIFHAIVG